MIVRRSPKKARWLALLLTVASAGCLDEWEIDERTFPCRSEEDCVEGYECDESRYVCVEAETATSTITRAAADADAGSLD